MEAAGSVCRCLPVEAARAGLHMDQVAGTRAPVGGGLHGMIFHLRNLNPTPPARHMRPASRICARTCHCSSIILYMQAMSDPSTAVHRGSLHLADAWWLHAGLPLHYAV